MNDQERRFQVTQTLSACQNVLMLMIWPPALKQWRERTSPSAVRETLLATLDNGLTVLASLRTQPIPSDLKWFHSEALLETEPALIELRRLIEEWDPATNPSEDLANRAAAYAGAVSPYVYGAELRWPDTGESIELSAMPNKGKDMVARAIGHTGVERTKAALEDILAGRLSGADAARALLPATGWVIGQCKERPRVGQALGQEGVRAVLGDKVRAEEGLHLLFQAEGERIGPFVESLGAEVVDLFVSRLERSIPTNQEWNERVVSALKAMADPAHPLLSARAIRGLAKLSKKALQELPLETVERAAELLVAQKEWAGLWRLLELLPAGLESVADEVVRAWEAGEPGGLELAKTASLGLRRQARRDVPAFEARVQEAVASGSVDRAARYLRALLEVTDQPQQSLEWLLGVIAAGTKEAESAVDTLAWVVMKKGTPAQAQALIRAGRGSPVFNPRVKDWLS